MLCLNQPKRCKKESRLGWTTNDRIILMRNDHFEYYTLHPGFVENDVESIRKKYFKAAVKI